MPGLNSHHTWQHNQKHLRFVRVCAGRSWFHAISRLRPTVSNKSQCAKSHITVALILQLSPLSLDSQHICVTDSWPEINISDNLLATPAIVALIHAYFRVWIHELEIVERTCTASALTVCTLERHRLSHASHTKSIAYSRNEQVTRYALHDSNVDSILYTHLQRNRLNVKPVDNDMTCVRGRTCTVRMWLGSKRYPDESCGSTTHRHRSVNNADAKPRP